MNRTRCSYWLMCLVWLGVVTGSSQRLFSQAGLREALERLDRNENGKIEPDEITPLARPYLERITEARRLPLDKPIEIERLQEAARVYYALKNGVAGRDVRPEDPATVRPFGPEAERPLVPEFGLGTLKYPYTQADVEQAEKTLARSDKNKDGLIDRDESAKAKWTHRNPFDSDLNEDGKLSRMELIQRYARRRLLAGAAVELIKKSRRSNVARPAEKPRLDPREEQRRWYQQRGADSYLTVAVLGRFDANRNGILEAAELKDADLPLSVMDQDRDGKLTRDELYAYLKQAQVTSGTAAAELPEWFAERDANRDGKVAMAEFAKEWSSEKAEEFVQLDANRDGYLTEDEVLGNPAGDVRTYRHAEPLVMPLGKNLESTVTVDDDFPIGDLNLQISITHTDVNDFDAYLTGPDGTKVELFTAVGGSGDHFENTILDDEARTSIARARPPFRGSYSPEPVMQQKPTLRQFYGKSIRGTWTLTIVATRNDQYGLIHYWSLIATPQREGGLPGIPPNTTPETPPATPPATPPLIDKPLPIPRRFGGRMGDFENFRDFKP